MLLNDFLSVAEVSSEAELLEQTIRFTREAGFETASVIAVMDRVGCDPVFFAVDNVLGNAAALQDDFERGRRDPVMQTARDRIFQ